MTNDEVEKKSAEEEEEARLKEVLDNYAKCRICNELLISPLTLPCLHSYCTPCMIKEIAALRQSNGSGGAKDIVCRECQEPFRLPPTDDELLSWARNNAFLFQVARAKRLSKTLVVAIDEN